MVKQRRIGSPVYHHTRKRWLPPLPSISQPHLTDGVISYALGRLRERAMRRTAWDRHVDTWEGLKAIFRALAHGEPKLALPALGGLFAPDVIPNLEGARIENRRLLSAIWRLVWLRPEGHTASFASSSAFAR